MSRTTSKPPLPNRPLSQLNRALALNVLERHRRSPRCGRGKLEQVLACGRGPRRMNEKKKRPQIPARRRQTRISRAPWDWRMTRKVMSWPLLAWPALCATMFSRYLVDGKTAAMSEGRYCQKASRQWAVRGTRGLTHLIILVVGALVEPHEGARHERLAPQLATFERTGSARQ